MNEIIKNLKENIDLLEAIHQNKHRFYVVTVISNEGKRTEIETREEHLDSVIEIVTENLEMVLDDLVERENQKQKLKIIRRKNP